jgi:hypothetical protein
VFLVEGNLGVSQVSVVLEFDFLVGFVARHEGFG